MKFLSVCSGIEAASVAWGPLGWQPFAFAEIEPFPSAVLAHHYPDVPNLGDITNFKDWPDGAIDLLCGGTPCQSFSVAGLRKGLADPRGNLMLTFGAIAARYRPRWLVWENVPGVLSSNEGRDFGAFLGLLGHIGYGYAYRVLDAQYFGVAQRRRRVFVVGCLGDWRSAAAVLFERHSLSWNPAPSREAGKVAPTIPSRSTAGGGLGTDFDLDGGVIAGTSQVGGKAAGSATQQDAESGLLIAHSLRGDGFDAGEDCTGRGTPLVPMFLHVNKGRPDGRQSAHTEMVSVKDIVETLTTDCHSQSAVALPLPFDTTQVTSQANRSNPKPGDPCHPLAAGAHAPAIAFHGSQDPDVSGDLAAPLGAQHNGMTNGVAVAFQERGRDGGRSLEVGGDVAFALLAPNGGGRAQERNVMTPAMQVRRLTPRECERLQGFPDDYTAIPWRTYQEAQRKGISYETLLAQRGMTLRGPSIEECPDGPRYKALGNSWAVPVVRWIGERIKAVERIHAERRAAA